ncbi:MAG: cytochrome c oxidase subunit 3 [Actinomycetota bacterium]
MAAVTARPPAPALRRPRTVMVGTLFASGASFMVFIGLMAVYLSRRSVARDAGTEWFPEGVVELGPSGWIFWTFVLSAFTIQWAVQAINNDDRPHAYVALAITVMFGASVFNQLWFIINDTGFALASTESQFMFFVVIGAFITFLIISMSFVVLTSLRALFGQYSPSQNDGVMAAAMYWHTVSAMYWILWIAIFVTK